MPTVKHVLRLGRPRDYLDTKRRPSCLCGWTTPEPAEDYGTAKAEGRGHIASVDAS